MSCLVYIYQPTYLYITDMLVSLRMFIVQAEADGQNRRLTSSLRLPKAEAGYRESYARSTGRKLGAQGRGL
jgi:hypothetical protein